MVVREGDDKKGGVKNMGPKGRDLRPESMTPEGACQKTSEKSFTPIWGVSGGRDTSLKIGTGSRKHLGFDRGK